MTERKQSPLAAIQGCMREYCLRDGDGAILGDDEGNVHTVWARDTAHANDLFGIKPAPFGVHASTVRRIEDETDETLRPIGIRAANRLQVCADCGGPLPSHDIGGIAYDSQALLGALCDDCFFKAEAGHE